MVVALTGKCCSGKNYISSIIESQGGFIQIDVDLVAREAFNESTEGIINIFGSGVLENGEISRRLVGDIVFENSGKRAELESVLHPLTYKKIFKIIEDSSKDWLINIPILKDENLINKCDAIIWIKSPLILRFIRALKRDSYSFITVIRRIMAQKELSVKHLKSDVDKYCIDNSWFSIGLKRDIIAVLKRLRRG